MRRQSFRKRPLKPDRQMQVVASVAEIMFEDEDGRLRQISSLDSAAVAGVVTTVQNREKRYNIPVPIIKYVTNYEAPSKPVPTSYIRYKKPLDEDFEKAVQYNMDLDDEIWLKKNQPKLTYDKFEHMIDLLEKTLHKKGRCTQADAEDIFRRRLGLFSLEDAKTTKQVRSYWFQKQNQLRKPLLRQFWPKTAISDTDPHNVFRPREKERYRLRKHRKNDMSAYDKLKMLRENFKYARRALSQIQKREELKKELIEFHNEAFEQQLYDLTDKTGKERKLNVTLRKIRPVPPVPTLRLTFRVDKSNEKAIRTAIGEKHKQQKSKKKLNKHATAHKRSVQSRPGSDMPAQEIFPSFLMRQGAPGRYPSLARRHPNIATCPPRKPVAYTCRGRFGRQGRFLIDRVPVWDTHRNRKRKRKWKQAQYARPPFSLSCVNQDLCHYKPARPTTYAAVGFETEKVFEPLKVSLKNLEDIYALSDSEDELFEAKQLLRRGEATGPPGALRGPDPEKHVSFQFGL